MGARQLHQLHSVLPNSSLQFVFQGQHQEVVPKVQREDSIPTVLRCQHGFRRHAAAGSLCIVYPLDYARTRLASDVGSGKKTFNGLGDCLKKTATGPGGFFALYAGFGVSLMGIIPYRGFQLGAFDTIVGLNPWKSDKGLLGFVTTFAAAQTAIIAGAGVSYPFDTVRRRLQMQAELP